ncbi:GntT/GntP/DsdX family permease, partial [Salmonella enterica]
EWVHVQLHQQKGMISLSPPTICNSAGATAIVAPMLPLYPDVSPEIIAIAIGSGAIGCTIVTDSLFWLVKQYCGATLNETFKYYTTATFIASVVALAGTFLLSFII